MSIAPSPATVKAAHEPSPANGLRGMPSTVTVTSVRGQLRRTTPSDAVVAATPAAWPICLASSFFGASAPSPIPTAPPMATEHTTSTLALFHFIYPPLLL